MYILPFSPKAFFWYLAYVSGIPRVLDHLLDPEARGFSWGWTCHCALNSALDHSNPTSLSFSHRRCDSWLWYWHHQNSPCCEFEVHRWMLIFDLDEMVFPPVIIPPHIQCVPPVQNLAPNLFPARESTQCTSLFWIACNKLLSVIDYHHS